MSFVYIEYGKWIFGKVLWRRSILCIKIEWETLTMFRFQSDGGSIRMSAFEYFKIYKAEEFTIWYRCQRGELSWKYFRYQNIKNTSRFGGVQDISRISQSTQPEFLKVRPTLHWFAEAKTNWQMTSALRDDLCTLESVEHISSETLLHILYSALVSRPHFFTSINFFLANVGLRDKSYAPLGQNNW